MAGVRVHVVMGPDLIQRIDEARGEGQSRGDWVRRVIEQALNRADGRAWARAEGEVADRFGLEPPKDAERALGLPGAPERTSGLQGSAPAPAPAEQPLDDTPAPSAELPPERASQLAEVDEILRGVARSPFERPPEQLSRSEMFKRASQR